MEKQGGIAFQHSHLGPGWQGMSGDDIRTEQAMAAQAKAATGLPLVGMTVGTDGAWSARFWEKTGPSSYERVWCESTRVIGEEGIGVTFDDKLIPPPKFRKELRRTISVWGMKKQQKLTRLKIGVVGAGSVGSVVAESLARLGIQKITLIDFDIVERHNMDRLLHAGKQDYLKKRLKVEVLAKGLKKGATAKHFAATPVPYSVTEDKGFREALDCDVLFSCVDRPWGRYVLNLIAYAHLIPVIDGGIAVHTKEDGTVLGADWQAHSAAPMRRCLECLGQYDSGYIELERRGHLADASGKLAGFMPRNCASSSSAFSRNPSAFAFARAAPSFASSAFAFNSADAISANGRPVNSIATPTATNEINNPSNKCSLRSENFRWRMIFNLTPIGLIFDSAQSRSFQKPFKNSRRSLCSGSLFSNSQSSPAQPIKTMKAPIRSTEPQIPNTETDRIVASKILTIFTVAGIQFAGAFLYPFHPVFGFFPHMAEPYLSIVASATAIHAGRPAGPTVRCVGLVRLPILPVAWRARTGTANWRASDGLRLELDFGCWWTHFSGPTI
jgi:hypothetical protein